MSRDNADCVGKPKGYKRSTPQISAKAQIALVSDRQQGSSHILAVWVIGAGRHSGISPAYDPPIQGCAERRRAVAAMDAGSPLVVESYTSPGRRSRQLAQAKDCLASV